MPEGGGNAPPLGLEAVGVIDLVQWLAIAGLCACCRAATVRLFHKRGCTRQNENKFSFALICTRFAVVMTRSQRLFLRGRGLAGRKD